MTLTQFLNVPFHIDIYIDEVSSTAPDIRSKALALSTSLPHAGDYFTVKSECYTQLYTGVYQYTRCTHVIHQLSV